MASLVCSCTGPQSLTPSLGDMNLYHTLSQHAIDGKVFFRVWDDTSPSRLVLTGTAATSGFHCESPRISLLTPTTYPDATDTLSLAKEHSSGVLQESIIRHISLNHDENEPPGMAKEDTSGLPNTDVSPWITVLTDLDSAIISIGRRLQKHPQRRQHLAVIRRANIVEKWTMVLPHIQACQERVPGASAFKQYLRQAAKRAKKEGEYVFYGRVFLSSILMDLGWTNERPGLELPPKFIKDNSSSIPPAWRSRELLPNLLKPPSTPAATKPLSKASKKVRQRLRSEHAARFAALLEQKARQPDISLGHGWAEWMLDVINRREASSSSDKGKIEKNLIEL